MIHYAHQLLVPQVLLMQSFEVVVHNQLQLDFAAAGDVVLGSGGIGELRGLRGFNGYQPASHAAAILVAKNRMIVDLNEYMYSCIMSPDHPRWHYQGYTNFIPNMRTLSPL